MSDSYSTFNIKLAELVGGISASNPSSATPFDSDNWNNMLTGIIDYAEGRIYRDPNFDFLTTYGAQNANCTQFSRDITKPATMLIVTAVNVITPTGSAPGAANSKRNALDPVTVPFIDAIWPFAYNAGDPTTIALPKYYAPLSDTSFRLAGTPDQAYTCEFIGTTRPVALSSSNTTTFLTTNLPELFLAAAMVFASGFMKNFGSQSDNPQQAQSWENQFQLLRTNVAVEEARKKHQGAAWTAKPPPPIATPPRS